MKVQHNENIQKSLFPEKINKNENAQGIDFGAVLKNEVCRWFSGSAWWLRGIPVFRVHIYSVAPR